MLTLIFFINIILIKSYRKWFQKKKLKVKKNIYVYIYRRTWSEPLSEIFFYKSTEIFFFLFSDLYSHHHLWGQPPPSPTRDPSHGHAAKERPTPRPSLPPSLAVPDPNGLEVTHPCRSAWMSGLAPNELELAKKGITGSGARSGGGGAVSFGGWEQDFGCWN